MQIMDLYSFLFVKIKFSFILEENLLKVKKIIAHHVVIKDLVCFKIMMRIILLDELSYFIIKMALKNDKVYYELSSFCLN